MARTFRHLLLVASTALAGASLPAHSHQDSDHVHLESTTLAEGLVHPWGMAFLPNGDLVVTERAGGIRVLKKDGTLTPRLSNVPEVAAVNQGGMLDITLDPDFEDNNTLYFCFSQPGEGGSSSSVARQPMPIMAFLMFLLSLVLPRLSTMVFTLVVALHLIMKGSYLLPLATDTSTWTKRKIPITTLVP